MTSSRILVIPCGLWRKRGVMGLDWLICHHFVLCLYGPSIRSSVAIRCLVSTSALVFLTSAGGPSAASFLASTLQLHQQQQQQQQHYHHHQHQHDGRIYRRSILPQRDSSCSLESATSTLSSNGILLPCVL